MSLLEATTTTTKATLATLAILKATTAVAIVEASLTTTTLVAGNATSSRTGSLLKSRRHNLGWEGEVLAKVLDALVGEVPVVPLPAELLGHVATGLEGSQQLDHVDVPNGELRVVVLGLVAIFLCDHNTLLEEVAVDGEAVLLRDKHCTIR